MRIAAVFAGCCLIAMPCAGAELAPLPASLAPLLTGQEHMTALLRAAHAVDAPGGPACREASYVTTGEVGVLAPLQTDAKGKVIGGAIKETVRETGCGMNRMLNAVTVFESAGGFQTHALLPGSTITDPQLQRDSVPFAAGAMGAMPAGCDQGGVVDTRFVGLDGGTPGTRPAAGSPPRPWTEIWSLQACARRVDVTIHFTPDATGTEIRAEPIGRP